jgi:mannosylglycerate hydrolase
VRAVEAAGAQALGDQSQAVTVGDRTISNDLIRIEVGDDGAFDVSGGGVRLEGVGRIVDGGDYGDTYNYGPPANDPIVERPSVVVVQPGERGPIRGTLEIVARYDWPVGLLPDGSSRSATTAPVEVTTTLELRTGEPFLRVSIAFVNPARDHRVRWHLPLPAPTDHSSAEGQFAVVDRGLTEEAGHGEVPTPTFPAHGFVHAAGATVLLDHVTEYELIDGRELALTILRSTGLISRNDNPFREDPAGPEVPVPAAQLVGPWRFGFALLPHAGTWEKAGVLAASEAYHHPFLTAPGTARTADPTPFPTAATLAMSSEITARPNETPAGLRLTGTGVVMSSLGRRDDWLEIRLVVEHPEATTAVLTASPVFTAAREVDLLGRTGAAIAIEPDGSIRLPMGPWEIRTVQARR